MFYFKGSSQEKTRWSVFFRPGSKNSTVAPLVAIQAKDFAIKQLPSTMHGGVTCDSEWALAMSNFLLFCIVRVHLKYGQTSILLVGKIMTHPLCLF